MGFDPVSYLMGKEAGGGGGDVTVEALTVTENGTVTAPSGKAYSPVTVNVGLSYDEFTWTGADTIAKNAISVQLLRNVLPVKIEIETETQGTVETDFQQGEVINIVLNPIENASIIENINDANGTGSYRRASGVFDLFRASWQQKSGTAMNEYWLSDEYLLSVNRVSNTQGFPTGVTYKVRAYYL